MANDEWDVIVVGAGAAGFVAAERSASRGLRTLLLEKNRKPGVKILISGGTRCNITHDTDARGIVAAFGRNGRFLHSALAKFSPRDVVAMFNAEGVATKVEKNGKVFPVSDTAVDVQQALLRRLDRSGGRLLLAEPVQSIRKEGAPFRLQTPSAVHACSSLIVTSGGLSYPGCGTTGDGYAWARQFGHTIIPTVPALAPLTSPESWIHALQGLTVEDVSLTVESTSKKHSPQCRGSMVLTHFGLSGPAPMNLSRDVSYAGPGKSVELVCDFLPGMARDELFQRLGAECRRHGKRQLASILGTIVFQRLADALVSEAGIDGSQHAAEVSNPQLYRLCDSIQRKRIRITGTLGYPKAEVTAGGVALGEIDSATMQSKLCPGLFFAGEILDLDGPIGGYNFQSAFSTGWTAGLHAGGMGK